MTIKASGRAALILATGIWVCAGGPSQAATDNSNAAAPAKHHHLKKYAHRKSGDVADKSSTDKKATEASADNSAAIQSSQMPASVANANAELAAGDTPTAANAKAMSARASDILQIAPDNQANTKPAAETQIVAADQLNDVDRALHETTTPAPAMASAEPPAAPAPQPAPMMAASNDSSTWDQTSLIGKIFIGFGALLTMASAARMFMA